MRARGNARRPKRRGGLLLTPLIDIIFLLVIFFVINTSFRQERYLDVALPESETSEDVQAEGILLTLHADGSTAVNGTSVAWEAVVAALRNAADETGAPLVVIRGDEEVPYGRIISALDRVKLAGLEAVTLQTVRASEVP